MGLSGLIQGLGPGVTHGFGVVVGDASQEVVANGVLD